MLRVSRDNINALLESETSITLSLYMPSHRYPTSHHINEDKIRLKNIIKQAKEALTTRGTEEEIRALLISNVERAFLVDESIWPKLTEGTAIFCSLSGIHVFNLPMECDEHVYVGDKYNIAPLLYTLSCNERYYLLAVATKNPVMFEGDMYGVEKRDIDFPKSIEEALNIDEMHSHSQTFRDRGSQPGHPGAKSHGQGDAKQAGQEERLKYFRLINEQILSSNVIDKNVPILLAGTEEEVSGFKEITANKQILSKSLYGNYTDASVDILHRLAWPVIEAEVCEKRMVKELNDFGNLLGTGRASTVKDEIRSAAKQGRVDTVYVGCLHETMDSVGDSSEPVKKIDLAKDCGEEDMMEIARSTYDQGGRVFAARKNEIPQNAYMAAVFRY